MQACVSISCWSWPGRAASEAAIYRAIKRWQPSFAIHEFDSVLASDDKAALRSVINFTRGAKPVALYRR